MQDYDYISILGPTASGKTALALALAEIRPIEIISVDSVSVYKGLDIGSAKPSMEERQKVMHHLIDVCDLRDIYTVGRFVKDVERLVEEIKGRGALPVLCGGTLMYVAAWRRGYQMVPDIDIRVSSVLDELYHRHGSEYLYGLLEKEDPEMAERLHPNDRQRIMRALAVRRETGKSLLSYWKETKKSRFQGKDVLLCVEDREAHRLKLRERVDQMLSMGLREECEEILAEYGEDVRNHPALRSIGYKEMIADILEKKTTNDVGEMIAVSTSQLMKRQMTWINSWENQPFKKVWIDKKNGNIKNILQTIVEYL